MSGRPLFNTNNDCFSDLQVRIVTSSHGKKVKTKIERMETSSGDYSAERSDDDCSIRLVCEAPREKNVRILPGSCHFT